MALKWQNIFERVERIFCVFKKGETRKIIEKLRHSFVKGFVEFTFDVKINFTFRDYRRLKTHFLGLFHSQFSPEIVLFNLRVIMSVLMLNENL